ncbi:MAG: hypothetical protein RLZZ46_455 [Bacteroidota bacterium]|jgi:NAD(P)H-hydrate epimerase
MRVLNTEEIKSADKKTIDSGQISALDLMEKAACACLPYIFKELAWRSQLLIFCGNGNNGADGLVIARHVAQTGKEVIIVSDDDDQNKSQLFLTNKARLVGYDAVHFVTFEILNSTVFLSGDLLIVDAIFGTGLRSAVKGDFIHWISWINQKNATVISIDMPSGCPGDAVFSDEKNPVAVRASMTLTFQFPRLSSFISLWRAFMGNIIFLPVGLLEPEVFEDNYFFVDRNFACSLVWDRNQSFHKGNFGHLFLAAGSSLYTGAAILACGGALRSGVGLVSAFVPASVKTTLNIACPEAIVRCSEDNLFLSGTPRINDYSAVAVGPGITKADSCTLLLKYIIGECRLPLLLDADALNILSENPTWLAFLPPKTILTPHPKEFERLVGKVKEGPETWSALRAFAAKWDLVVVLKGRNSMIATPNRNIYFNGSGNAGMAKGGSGDVLSGIIGGLLAQGYLPEHAAILGTHIHGVAGDFAASDQGQHGMTPQSIVHYLDKAWLNLKTSSII